jgi:hypothetical protein
MDVAGKWLDLDGVDMIIPRPEANEVVVIVSCPPDNLKHLLPHSIQDIVVRTCYKKFYAA